MALEPFQDGRLFEAMGAGEVEDARAWLDDLLCDGILELLARPKLLDISAPLRPIVRDLSQQPTMPQLRECTPAAIQT